MAEQGSYPLNGRVPGLSSKDSVTGVVAGATADIPLSFFTPGPASPLPPISGGTGVISPAAHGVLVGEGTSPVNVILPGAAGYLLASNGTTNDPSFQAVTSSSITYNQGAPAAVTRSVTARLQDSVSVKDLGALGDGVTNDAPAINAAIAWMVGNGGGTLLFPPGTYICNAAIVINGSGSRQNSANIHLVGSGGYSTILNFAGAGAGIDGIQVTSAGRWSIEGLAILNSRNYGLNLNAGISPGGISYSTRWAIRDVIVDGSVSHGIYQANTYMALMEDIESRNNGGDGFHFAGDHTSITCIRCWGGGDQVSPNGGNGGYGWWINGIVYSSFVSCASDNNVAAGWSFSNVGAVEVVGCGSEANRQEGFIVVASSANNTGVPVPGVRSIAFNGCFGNNNSLASVNTFANFLGISTANSINANVTVKDCTDILAGSQTLSLVANGTSGTVFLSESDNTLTGTYSFSGTVVEGQFISAQQSSGSPISLSNGVTANVTSLSLPPGDWDVFGVVDFNPAATTTVTVYEAGISTSSGAFGGQDTFISTRVPSFAPNGVWNLASPSVRVRSTGGQSVYLVTVVLFGVSTLTTYGTIFAKKAT